MVEEDKKDLARRSFLQWILNLSLASSVTSLFGVLFYPVLRFVNAPRIPESEATSVVAGKLGDLAMNSGKVVRFGSKPAIVVRTAAGDLKAFSAVCTHLQCIAQYRPDMERIWCACHNGQFDLSGRNVAGPPPRPLEEYAVAVRGDDVILSRKG